MAQFQIQGSSSSDMNEIIIELYDWLKTHELMSGRGDCYAMKDISINGEVFVVRLERKSE